MNSQLINCWSIFQQYPLRTLAEVNWAWIVAIKVWKTYDLLWAEERLFSTDKTVYFCDL